jgi:hypothetical protein
MKELPSSGSENIAASSLGICAIRFKYIDWLTNLIAIHHVANRLGSFGKKPVEANGQSQGFPPT